MSRKWDTPENFVGYFTDIYDYWVNDPRGQYELWTILDKLTFGLLSHDEHMKEMDETLQLYGLTWSDIKYKGKTIGNDGSLPHALNYISNNVSRLYR